MSQNSITLGGQTVTVVSVPTSPGIRAVQFSPFDAVSNVRSVFTGQTQAQQWPGADLFSGTLTLPSLSQAQADDWISFLMQCRGRANAFMVGDPAKKSPRGSGSGTPFVDNNQNGGNPAGSQWLGTKGWTANAQGVLRRGDWIQVGWRLYRVLDDINADGYGNALLPIWPSLREQPTNDGTTNLAVNANGSVHGFHSAPVNPCAWGIEWTGFQLVPGVTLPLDAVVQAIYPVIVLSTAQGAGSTPIYQAKFGNDGQPVWSYGRSYGSGFSGFVGGTIYTNQEFSDNLAARGYANITVADLANFYIGVEILSTTSTDFDATISVSSVGFAVYYSSATPTTDSTTMTPPVAVPAGQGVAWALPFGVAWGDGNTSTGSATGVAASANGGLGLTNPRGLFRLAENKRDWTADFTRRTQLGVKVEEYR